MVFWGRPLVIFSAALYGVSLVFLRLSELEPSEYVLGELLQIADDLQAVVVGWIPAGPHAVAVAVVVQIAEDLQAVVVG